MQRILLLVVFIVSTFSHAAPFECSAYVVLEGGDLPPFRDSLTRFKNKIPTNQLVNPEFSLKTLDLSSLYEDHFWNYCVFVFAHGRVSDKGKFELLSKDGWIDANDLGKLFPDRPHVVNLFSCFSGSAYTNRSFPNAERVFVAAPENDVALDRDVQAYLFHIIHDRGELTGDPELIFKQWQKAEIKSPAGPIRYGYFTDRNKIEGMVRRQDDPYADNPRREEILERNLIRIRPRRRLIDE